MAHGCCTPSEPFAHPCSACIGCYRQFHPDIRNRQEAARRLEKAHRDMHEASQGIIRMESGASVCYQPWFLIPPTHGGRPLDIENSIKPSVDAFAAGLFCSN